MTDAPPAETFLQRQLRKKAEREAATRPALAPTGTGRVVGADSPRAAAWVQAKVDAQLTSVASAPEGTRNHTLNAAAYSLGRLAPAYLDAQQLADHLLDAALSAGLDPVEARNTIRSGLKGGLEAPREVTLADDPLRELSGLVAGGARIPAPRVDTRTGEILNPQPRVEGESQGEVEGSELSPEEIAERAHATRVLLELQVLRARHDAKMQHAAELAARHFRAPAYTRSLTEELLIPDTPVTYAVDQLLPTGGNALLAAQFKAGKTTLITNLVKAYADDEPFLGRFAVSPAEGRIAVFNYELSPDQYRRWLRQAGIRNTDRVAVLHLRGHRLPLTSPPVEDWIVDWLLEQQVTFWIADPFARAAVGTDENSNTEVGVWLDTFDVIKERAGVRDAVLPTHTGRAVQEQGQERARGATRLDDWADVRWLLNKDEEDNRFFRATGRDVEVAEELLTYQEETRGLVFGGGDRDWVKKRALAQAVLDYVNANPGCGVKAIQVGVRGNKEQIDGARLDLIRRHRVRVEDGPRGAQNHFGNGPEA